MKALSHVVPSAILQLLKDTPLSAGKVGFAWRAAVGPALDRVTRVRLEQRVLVVDTDGPQWAQAVKRSSPLILQRLQQFLGADAVERIEVRRA